MSTFHKYYTETAGCWEWTGGKNQKGYGMYRFLANGSYRTQAAHRYFYEQINGRLPARVLVCHSCDNPSCVNPDHLFIGSNLDNMQDMRSKNRQAKWDKKKLTKLNPASALMIKHLYADGHGTIRSIAEAFGVCPSVVQQINFGRNWSHV